MMNLLKANLVELNDYESNTEDIDALAESDPHP